MTKDVHRVSRKRLVGTRNLPGAIGLIQMALLVFSCNENNVIVTTPFAGQNQPVITVSRNVFTFSVDAVALSFLSSGDVSFTGDSLLYTLSIMGYRLGGGLFKVTDASGNTILSDSLHFDRTIVNTVVMGRVPARYTISLENFTGRVSIVLSGGQSTQVFKLQDFPNTIGTSWTYAIFDSLAQQADTAVVTVVGQIILPNTRPATIWRTAYRSRVDSQYVVVSGDTVAIYYGTDVTAYVFPLHVGTRWKGLFENNSSTVTQRAMISVPAGSFQNGFKIERAMSGLNLYTRNSVWMVPQVGIVDVHRTTFGFEFENSTWKLLTYFVAP